MIRPKLAQEGQRPEKKAGSAGHDNGDKYESLHQDALRLINAATLCQPRGLAQGVPRVRQRAYDHVAVREVRARVLVAPNLLPDEALEGFLIYIYIYIYRERERER